MSESGSKQFRWGPHPDGSLAEAIEWITEGHRQGAWPNVRDALPSLLDENEKYRAFVARLRATLDECLMKGEVGPLLKVVREGLDELK